MSSIRLPKHFLEDNPLNDISTALLTQKQVQIMTKQIGIKKDLQLGQDD